MLSSNQSSWIKVDANEQKYHAPNKLDANRSKSVALENGKQSMPFERNRCQSRELDA